MNKCIPSLVSILSLVAALPLLSIAPASAGGTSYLRPGDVIVCVGDSVTDNTEFKFGATPLFWLTGHQGMEQEQMGFVQLSDRDEGVLYRIGY